MPFDQATRNRLQKFVSNTRSLLVQEFTRQFQNDYGIDPQSGEISNLASLAQLDDSRFETARLLRETLKHYLVGSPNHNVHDCIERIVREQAFTFLNRICALRMAEARGIIIESISKGYNSKGYQLYSRLAGTSLGETGDTYRFYILSLFDELALDLPVLFDRFNSQGRLFPKEATLLQVLELINDSDIGHLWTEDEAIGWIYQYFNSQEERRQMRDESQAPRNSRELAVRNQFFTPRYVVEFLSDNTLGRIWYEMTQGHTILKEQCQYMVIRPNEVFLAKGEDAPSQNDDSENLSQEEILKQPVYIPWRQLKDPRDILMLDPACGSMHFGLYAFDLFETIYSEAWDMEADENIKFTRGEHLKPLRDSYSNKEEFLRNVPKLIVEYNIHGIDIDSRAVQIAGLSIWLRAQKSWQIKNIKPHERPQINRSNIVCAEPMPGDREMLKEFTKNLKPRVLGQLVESIFDKMELAGEAGSLLKIEEEIEEAVNQAREEFNKEVLLRKVADNTLFPELAPPRQQTLFDFADLPDKTTFWNDVEDKIINSLRDYAEKTDIVEATRKRLFAQDAAKGFAFIDVCRKKYDVVLMNPPFGSSSILSQRYLKKEYSKSNVDVFASFVERGIYLIESNGYCGAITNRTGFFITHLEEWRRTLFSSYLNPFLIADLGSGVLDNALVETAAYIIGNNTSKNLTVFDCRQNDNYLDLSKNINGLNINKLSKAVHLVSIKSILSLPKASLAYWFSSDVFRWYNEYKSAEPSVLEARMGLRTLDDFRFLKLWWETSTNDNYWLPHSKGGEYSRFFSDIHLRINWKQDGLELKALAVKKYSSVSRTIQAQDYYFRRGLTYSQRTSSRLSVRQMVPGGNFSAKGPLIVTVREPEIEWLYYLLGFLNSDLIEYLITVGISASDDAARSYDVGLFQRLPFKEPNFEIFHEISELTKSAIILAQKRNSWNETDQSFVGLELLCWSKLFKQIRCYYEELNHIHDRINMAVYNLYDVSSKVINEVKTYFYNAKGTEKLPSETELVNSLWSYLVGVTLGRWNLCLIKDDRSPRLIDPFSTLSTCPPGMLQNDNGLPADPEDVPDDYPIRITWSGIMVDDEGHPEDIVSRIREAMEVIWKDRAEDIEQEACEILEVNSLREYFLKPGNFFADHLKRYSKSRRQAPIYWPISTTSGSYTLWLYYHRLTDQTLYTCVNDFVDPKLKQISESVVSLRRKSNRSNADERELEKLFELEIELQDFKNELLRIAAFWKPNLNDGVQITAAPLWSLFRLRTWQTKLKETWQKLEKGDYDWAHLAYSIWPNRVSEKCKSDKSVAIAHGLENLYQEKPVKGKKKPAAKKK